MDYILVKYAHFLGIFAVVGGVFAQLCMIKPQMSRKDLKQIAKIDGIYGAGAIITVAAGLTLWLSDIGKPAEFYQENGLVHLKLAIFTVVGLLSLHPTIFLARNRWSKKQPDGDELVDLPRSVGTVIKIELGLLLIMPFLGSSMAMGLKLF